MITVKILGSGCTKCKTLYAKVQDIAAQHNLPVTVTKVEDLMEIMKYGILSTPGFVINEKVKSAGNIPGDEQILTWIKEG